MIDDHAEVYPATFPRNISAVTCNATINCIKVIVYYSGHMVTAEKNRQKIRFQKKRSEPVKDPASTTPIFNSNQNTRVCNKSEKPRMDLRGSSIKIFSVRTA